jgi:hypothetical protein
MDMVDYMEELAKKEFQGIFQRKMGFYRVPRALGSNRHVG